MTVVQDEYLLVYQHLPDIGPRNKVKENGRMELVFYYIA